MGRHGVFDGGVGVASVVERTDAVQATILLFEREVATTVGGNARVDGALLVNALVLVELTAGLAVQRPNAVKFLCRDVEAGPGR